MDSSSSSTGGGPAPFLIKTYDMVDDSSTDDIVSWSPSHSSFVVWNPPDFSSRLLPTYFKHNNFSSFIRQLNTYGFRKIDPERWEFANEEFIKGRKHLLKNIHRRKPIHSHSNHPHGSALLDSDRIALEDEIDRLSRERAALHADLWRFKQQQTGTKSHLQDLERRLTDIEERQNRMIAFLRRALENPKFVENLVRMAGSGTGTAELLVMHKKRRLPELEGGDKLKLELCSAISDGTRSSSSGIAVDVCDRRSALCGSDEDGMIACQLSLALATSSMEVERGVDEGLGGKNSESKVVEDVVHDKPGGDRGPVAPAGGVNDVFWEQFLTERPGSSDTEEASSSLRANSGDEQQEERNSGSEGMWRNRKDMEQLTL